MENHKSKRNILNGIFLGVIFSFLCVFHTDAAEGDMIQSAKNGIVEVYSGYMNDKDEFESVEHASGFLIYNEENTAYVLTTYDTLISDEYEGEAVIKVVVGKDVKEDADIYTYSKQENYALLEVRTSISEKQALNLGNSSELSVGDTIYALGFPKNEDNKLDFLAYDVEIKEGEIQDTAAKKENTYYLQHSAKITVHSTGGPLLNEEGYVVGLNNAQMNQKDEEIYYSLPVDEIKEILDNYDLKYGNNEKDALWSQFVTLYEECKTLTQDETYKKKTRTALTQVLTQVEPVFEESLNNIEDSEIEEYMKMLEDGKLLLQPKTRTTLKVIYVLAAFIIILGLWLIKLLIGRRKFKQNTPKKPKKKEKVKSYDYPENTGSGKSPEKYNDPYNDGTVMIQENEMEKYLKSSRRKAAMMIRVKDGKETSVSSDMFYIGKKAGENDFVITGNGAISRRHACISWDNGSYYIMDLGSANGTFIGNERLDSKVKVKLENNTRLVLADETFIFRIKEY